MKITVPPPGSPTDEEAILETSALVMTLLMSGNIIDIRDIKVEDCDGQHLATILRTSYKRRDKVLGWHSGLSVAIIALKRDNIDYKDALYGLL